MPVRSESRFDGAVRRLILDRPKANIVSIELVDELRGVIRSIVDPHVKLVTLEGEGEHFSYGAAVDEHVPGLIGRVFGALDGLMRDLLSIAAPTAAIVRGRCLGGGFEIALGCDFLFAAESAVLGLPEVVLGVFPPLASAILPARIGASRAASVVVTGESRPAAWWAQAGLIEAVAPAAALADVVDDFYRARLAPRSAVALGAAALASRVAVQRQLEAVLPQLERLYLDDLMQTHDAGEGIAAFVEKRAPRWSDA